MIFNHKDFVGSGFDPPEIIQMFCDAAEACNIVKIDDTHVAIAYRTETNDGIIKIFKVHGGKLVKEVESFEFDYNVIN